MAISNIICPMCSGAGDDTAYGKASFCILCDGSGRIAVDPLGDIKNFKWKQQNVPAKEFESDLQLSYDMFVWAKTEYSGQNWYEVHATMPMLLTIENTLLKAGQIVLGDIPGGPNHKYSPKMTTFIKEAQLRQEATAKAVVQQAAAKTNQDYKSYRDNLKEAAKSAADLHIPTMGNTITEEQVMSIPDRLKSGGRTVAEVIKEGAMIGTITAANKSAIDIMIYKMGDKCPEMLKTPAGRQALELALPALMLMATEMDDGNRIPGKDYVANAATLALKGTSAEATEALTSVVMEHMGVLFMTYAAAGKELADQAVVKQALDTAEFEETSAPAVIEESLPEPALTFE